MMTTSDWMPPTRKAQWRNLSVWYRIVGETVVIEQVRDYLMQPVSLSDIELAALISSLTYYEEHK